MAARSRRTLHNGIRLPTVWPPRRRRFARRPQAVPYLTHPPGTINIDAGRQLLVDDFLIEKTTLTRTFHRAEYHPACPVLAAQRPWERVDGLDNAAPFSDGVWFDPADGLFKLWYLAGKYDATCYATSRDGVRWTRPKLDVEPGTNVVVRGRRDSATIWLDHNESNPRRRFKMLYLGWRRGWVLILRYSADGIHWGRPVATEPVHGDRSTFHFDPFRGVWVMSLRNYHWPIANTVGRARLYREHADLEQALKDCDARGVVWVSADNLDPHHTNPRYRSIPPQLYNFDAAPYESIMLGQYSVWQGPDNAESHRVGNHKRCEILLGFSRDGFHFARPDRTPFMPVDEVDGAWNWGNVQSCAGGPLVVGDRLYFYCSGRALDRTGRQARMSTGLATLRRDGFASMDAATAGGRLTTRPLTFSGSHLFVNADIRRGGQLRVDVLDRRGKIVKPLSRANCLPVKGDSTCHAVWWRSEDGPEPCDPVRFRFHLTRGKLYSFWVSSDASGASRGYVGAGGPGFDGPIDTAGQGEFT